MGKQCIIFLENQNSGNENLIYENSSWNLFIKYYFEVCIGWRMKWRMR